MRILGVLVALALLAAGMPACADPGLNDDSPSVYGGKPLSRSNINRVDNSQSPGVSNFPQGKNSAVTVSRISAPSANEPKKPICVGNDCGCSSGRGH
jgi:hypothetical protein